MDWVSAAIAVAVIMAWTVLLWCGEKYGWGYGRNDADEADSTRVKIQPLVNATEINPNTRAVR